MGRRMWPAWTNVMLHQAEAALIAVCLDEFVTDHGFHLSSLDMLRFLEILRNTLLHFASSQPQTHIDCDVYSIKYTNKASLNIPLLLTQMCPELSTHIMSVCICVGVCLFFVFRPNLDQDSAQGIFTAVCSCELISHPCAYECACNLSVTYAAAAAFHRISLSSLWRLHKVKQGEHLVG